MTQEREKLDDHTPDMTQRVRTVQLYFTDDEWETFRTNVDQLRAAWGHDYTLTGAVAKAVQSSRQTCLEVRMSKERRACPDCRQMAKLAGVYAATIGIAASALEHGLVEEALDELNRVANLSYDNIDEFFSNGGYLNDEQ